MVWLMTLSACLSFDLAPNRAKRLSGDWIITGVKGVLISPPIGQKGYPAEHVIFRAILF